MRQRPGLDIAINAEVVVYLMPFPASTQRPRSDWSYDVIPATGQSSGSGITLALEYTRTASSS